MGYKTHTTCRVCGNTDLKEYLNLGMMPLSNNLLDTPDQECKRYPLKVLLCEECGLSQLSIVVFPETMFSNYVYRSGISQGYKDHCKQMAIDLGVKDGDFVIDIAGNDGTLLKEFKRFGCNVLNVDPATNLLQYNEPEGVRMFNAFWGMAAAKHLVATQWPKADYITATNVFAHVDDVRDFLEACKLVLAPDGRIVLEFPYLIDFIEKVEFDTVYFEHLSYFSVSPLDKLSEKCGLSIEKITRFPIHGGSLRVELMHEQDPLPTEETADYEINELDNYWAITVYEEWATQVRDTIFQFRAGINKLKAEGYRIAGFAASAKGNTLLNAAGITSQLDYIIDETPEKVGKYSPGTGIPIVPMPTEWPDYLVILSWNFADEIRIKTRAAGYKGFYILPLTFEVCR